MQTVDGAPAQRVAAPLFVALSVAFFAPAFYAGKVPVFRDLLILVIPLRGYARESLHGGRLPLWTSELFFGAPFLANYQSAVLYPPSLIIYLLPFPLGLSVFLAFHLFVAGMGMFRFLRDRLRLAPGACFFGGVVFGFGGFLLSLVPLTNQLEVAAWIPWVLHAGRGIGTKRDGAPLIRLALLLFLQMLGGAPEALMLSLALLFADGLVSSSRGDIWMTLVRLTGAAIAAGALAAFQLVPTLAYVLTTDRATALSPSSIFSESLTPISLWQFLVPHQFLAGAPAFIPEGKIPIFWSLYAGVIPLALVASSVARREARLWQAVLAVGVILALGETLPFLPALHLLLPAVVGAFRYPAKFFLLSHVAIAVLAAHALDGCLRDRSMRRSAVVALSVVFIALAGLRIGAAFAPRSLLATLGYPMLAELSPGAIDVLTAGVGGALDRGIPLAVAGLIVIGLFASGRIGSGLFTATVLAITVVDLLPLHQPSLVFTDWQRLKGEALRLPWSRGARVFHYCMSGPGCLPPGATGIGAWRGTLRPGENAEGNALYVAAASTPDLPILDGIGAVAGTDGLSTVDQREFFDTLATLARPSALHLLAALGVDRVVGPEPLADLALADPVRANFEDRSLWSYALHEAAPRLYLADRVIEADDVRSALTQASSPDFRAGHDVVLLRERGSRPSVEGGGSIAETSFGEHRVRARATLARDGVLVVANSFAPGWKATIDGEPTPLLRANGVLTAIELAAGSHAVELRYDPWPFKVGATATVLTAIGMLALALRARVANPA